MSAQNIVPGSWVIRKGGGPGSPQGEVIAKHGGYAWVKFPDCPCLEPTTHNLFNLVRMR